MVSQAVDEGLVTRIQNYVANDVNSKTPDGFVYVESKITPEEVRVVSFTRLFNNWQAVATAMGFPDRLYEVIHHGDTNKTFVTVYTKRVTHQAII